MLKARSHTDTRSRPARTRGLDVRPGPLARAVALALALAVVAIPTPARAAGSTARKGLEWPLTDLGLLYRNEANPTVQEAWFLGRYHGQFHYADGSVDNDKGWENRRFRVGGQVRLFHRLTLHAQMVSGVDLERFYNGFTELWASWKFNDAVTLTIGQQKHRFTHDRTVSSRYLNYLERAMLTNMFALDYTPAVTLSGKVVGWSYYTGVFSNATGRDMGDSFTDYDSGYSLLLSLNREIGKFAKDGTANLHLSWVYSDANSEATNLKRFDQGLSSALILTEGPASFVTELTAGFGSATGNAYGINLQPGWFVTKRTQLVGRYQFAVGDDPAGLQAQRRYERSTGMTTGDVYHAGYFGVNYYLAQHRIKLMTGVEYSSLGGEHAWTGSMAIRVFWGPNPAGIFPTGRVLEPSAEDTGD